MAPRYLKELIERKTKSSFNLRSDNKNTYLVYSENETGFWC